MMNKELTKDSITGAIFNDVTIREGQHWMKDEDVVEIRLKQDEDSNSTNIYVLSTDAAYRLRHELGLALDQQLRRHTASQPTRWEEFAD
jgi:2-keto-4-pentenoate hydratase/2-oxohepta-3-ene-1,7-dioic acid hydratase in catechol pathway